MTSPYRDPAKMTESALMCDRNRLQREVDRLRGSVRRAWSWACLWVCVLGSITIMEYMALRECLEKVK